MADYDPRSIHERDYDLHAELKWFAVASVVVLPEVFEPGFGRGLDLLFIAGATCLLWQWAGRHDGCLLTLFKYFATLTVAGWLGLAPWMVLACLGYGAWRLWQTVKAG